MGEAFQALPDRRREDAVLYGGRPADSATSALRAVCLLPLEWCALRNGRHRLAVEQPAAWRRDRGAALRLLAGVCSADARAVAGSARGGLLCHRTGGGVAVLSAVRFPPEHWHRRQGADHRPVAALGMLQLPRS